MGHGSIVTSTPAEVKTSGITEGSPLFHAMNKFMSKFNKLEERMFGAPFATSSHAAYISKLAPAFSQPQYERPFHNYYDQYGRLVFDNQSELASSAHETDRANSGGASTIPPSKRLSYCYIDQNGKLIFRKKSELVSSAPETDKTNLGEVSTILPAAT
jgi:hypothetical protein